MNRDERAKLLKDRKELVRKEPFWCKDTWRDFEVYWVPVDALLLNADNRRFAAEKKLMEEKVGHALDPENNPSTSSRSFPSCSTRASMLTAM